MAAGSNGYVAFVGNLRSDISKGELHAKLRFIFNSFNIQIRNTEIRRKSPRKPTHVFVELDDGSSLNDAIARINGLVSKDVSFEDRRIVVAPKLSPKYGPGKNIVKHKPRNRHGGRPQHNSGVKLDGQIPLNNVQGKMVLPPLHNDRLQFENQALDFLAHRGKHYFVGQKLGTEDRLTEYKKGGGRYLDKNFKEHVGKYVCAFLNSEGGTLLIGVSDDCIVCGVECSNQQEDKLRLEVDAVIKGFTPPVFPDAYSTTFIPVFVPYQVEPPSTSTSFPVSCNPQLDQTSLYAVSSESGTPAGIFDNDPCQSTSFKPNPYDAIQSIASTSHNPENGLGILQSKILKVIEISVNPPKGHSTSVLYESHKGEAYLRRDGSIQGPLKTSQIIEWTMQHRDNSYHIEILQKENESLRSENTRKHEEIEMNLKLVNEIVKQKEFIVDQHQLKLDEFKKKEQELQELQDRIRNQENQVPKTNSKVCAIL